MSTTQNAGVRPPSGRLLRRWDVGETPELTPVTDEPGDRTWRVETATGPLLLRRFEGIARRQVFVQLEVTAALAAADLPVPAPIPTVDGRRLVESGHLRYALYPWIDGRPRDALELSMGACHALGGLLGRLHGELDRLTPPVQQSMLVPTARVHDTIAHIDRLLDDGGDQCLSERRDLLVEFADHQPPEAETYTLGYVHGDFHAERLRFGAYTGGVVAVLGWDRLTIAPFAAELVRAATLLFGDGLVLDLDRIESFVRGYAAAFPLDAGQIQSAAHRLWWARLCDLNSLEQPHPDDTALVAWWSANLDRTLDAFAAPYVRTAD
ncbi:MAG: phosphotransferase enzyme family protein [Actinomadura sp.]